LVQGVADLTKRHEDETLGRRNNQAFGRKKNIFYQYFLFRFSEQILQVLDEVRVSILGMFFIKMKLKDETVLTDNP
jgi:hypothetical protein